MYFHSKGSVKSKNLLFTGLITVKTMAKRIIFTHKKHKNMKTKLLITLSLFSLAMLQSLPSNAARVKDLANVAGVRSNQLVGYGLVVGLDGTGDQTTQTPFTTQSIISLLGQLGVNLPAGVSMQLKNVAAVSVTASLPAYAKPGQTLDVTVSSIGNAKNLRGGTLVMTPLKGADNNVYAVAQGSIVIPGAGATGAAGASVQINSLNAGRIPNGATVERLVSSSVGQGNYLDLELKETDFTTASRMVAAINQTLGQPQALAMDGRLVRVQAPTEPQARIDFLAQLENVVVTPSEASPKVVINARTGSVVMNQLVSVQPCAVAHGNLTITITAEPVVSQPNILAAGKTVVITKTLIDIKTDKTGLSLIPKSPTLNEIVKALNSMGANAQDLLAVLQAMKSAGALQADLEII